MADKTMGSGEILLYQNGADKEFVSVVFEDENFWLSQNSMAELFDCTPENVIQHLKQIYAEEELSLDATAKKFLVVRKEGTRNVRRKVLVGKGGISQFDRETARYLKGGDPK